MSNINDTYFDGYYKEIWKNIIPEVLTQKEVEFIIPYFNLNEDCKVLDLMCGYGRHAAALGRKGIQVTAVDNLPEYIDELNAVVANENLPVKTILSGVLDFNTEEKFDLAIIMGNSLNFFDANDTFKIFTNIYLGLKKGGHLLINSWSIAEIVKNSFRENSNSEVGTLKFLTKSRILSNPFRIETESTIMAPDGKKELKTGVDYIFSLPELEKMLNETGFTLQEVYSIPGRKKFTVGEPRAYLVAVKS